MSSIQITNIWDTSVLMHSICILEKKRGGTMRSRSDRTFFFHLARIRNGLLDQKHIGQDGINIYLILTRQGQ